MDIVTLKIKGKEMIKLRHFIRAFQPGSNLKPGFLLAALVFLLNCSGPRMYVQPNADFTFIKKVAVLSFKNLTNDKFAGDKIRDIVTTEVLSREFFDVVEQGEVNRVLKEEGKGSVTSVSKEVAKRIGKRLGIQAFILGSVEEYGTNQGGGKSFPHAALSMRMIAADSSKILWHVSYNKEGGSILSRLFGIGSKNISEISCELVEDMMDTLFE